MQIGYKKFVLGVLFCVTTVIFTSCNEKRDNNSGQHSPIHKPSNASDYLKKNFGKRELSPQDICDIQRILYTLPLTVQKDSIDQFYGSLMELEISNAPQQSTWVDDQGNTILEIQFIPRPGTFSALLECDATFWVIFRLLYTGNESKVDAMNFDNGGSKLKLKGTFFDAERSGTNGMVLIFYWMFKE